ncbi:MAG TPA: glycosyltransferase family 87 protein [Candidatus Dormibacteraeota bacterium]|nr:glycosyltransferase family 87 protein [Candidatus Dormibacteraeota bacterium]
MITASPRAGASLTTILRRNRRLLDRALRVAFVVVLVLFAIFRPVPAGDAHAYWVVDLTNPYTRPIATTDAFTYPPPAALFFSVLGHLPFEVFEAIWTLLIGFALLWLTGPFALLFLVIPVVASDLYLGNIHVLLGAAVVGSLRRPGLWAIPLLTKPTVGVGLLWFAARGEWRRLATAIGVTAIISAIAFVLAPGLWKAWLDYVLATGVSPDVGTAYWVPIPLLVRLPAAALLVIWGARTNRAWTLPVAAMLGLPVLWLVGLAMLTAAFAISAWGPLRAQAQAWIARRT